jgi:L-threonylcarbamoyladenylate synthase
MEIISNPTQIDIEKAAKALIDGHLVAFPTETVYGLGADAVNKKAVGRIYSVKGRPTNHPLIVHISSITQLDKWAIDIPKYALKLAEEFWPGPITLILKRNYLAKDFITGGQDNVGIRIPSNPIALELLNEFEKLGGFGVAAPSANRFRAVSPTNLIAVNEEIGNRLSQHDFILGGGDCLIGLESTIIDCTNINPTILRPGAVTPSIFEIDNTKNKVISPVNKSIQFPGSLDSHYSPRANVVLGGVAEVGAGYIALSDIATPSGAIRLAAPENIEEFARTMYEALREGDRLNLKSIVVILPNGQGLAVAIRDRLEKASHKIKS